MPSLQCGKWCKSKSPYYRAAEDLSFKSPETPCPRVERKRLHFSNSSVVGPSPQPANGNQSRLPGLVLFPKKLGTKRTRNKKGSTDVFKCPLSKRLKAHLIGKRHGLHKQVAKDLSLPVRTADGRYRRRCPLSRCRTVVVRVPNHLRNQHKEENFSADQIRRLSRRAEVFIPHTVSVLTPSKKGKETSATEQMPGPSTSDNRIEAGPSSSDNRIQGDTRLIPIPSSEPPTLTVDPTPLPGAPRQRLPDDMISKQRTYFPFIVNYRSTYEKKCRQQMTETQANAETERLPAAMLCSYFRLLMWNTYSRGFEHLGPTHATS